MQNIRLTQCLVVVLLLSSTLTIIPGASSQQFTTTTSLQTSTISVTSAFTQTATNTRHINFVTSISIGTGTLTGANYTYHSLQGTVCNLSLFGFFNSTGMTSFEYWVGGSMTLYILNGQVTPGVLAGYLTEPDCYTPYLAYADYPGYVEQISAGSGSFNLNLPTGSNPYTYALVAPLSEGSPTATLTISPIRGTYKSITTSAIAGTSTTSGSTTLTFLTTLASVTVLEVPFTSDWLPVAVTALIILIIFTIYGVAVVVAPLRRRRVGDAFIETAAEISRG